VTEQEPEPGRDDAQATRLRWILRAGVLAIAIYFLADGLTGIWPEASSTTRVVIVVVTVLVVGLAALAAFRLARRDRQG
jgi:hypothetical protein